MKELFIKYFRDASSYQSIDPTCFNLQEYTETWLINNKEQLKQCDIPVFGWRSEQLPDFDVQEINEILQDCREKQEGFTALICRIWNKGYMTAVADEREG